MLFNTEARREQRGAQRIEGRHLWRNLLRTIGCLAALATVPLMLGCTTPSAMGVPNVEGLDASPHDLAITEIMYHPGDFGDAVSADLEFIELYNRGKTAIDLSGVHFSAAIDYAFADGALLEPDSYVVLASSASAFLGRYGFSPDGEYVGQLNNGGERITVNAADDSELISVRYDDEAPWPTSAAGLGFSLVLRDVSNISADLDNASNWQFGAPAGGSPGTVNLVQEVLVTGVVINEILTHTDPPLADAVEIYNTWTDSQDIGGWFLTDDRSEPRKYRIPDGVELGPHGFHVVSEEELGFGFSSFGEEVYLFAADPLGNLLGNSHGFGFGTAANGVSFGRYLTSEGRRRFPPQQARTLGAENAGPLVGPVVISEIMYHPPNGGDEYIRLTNIAAQVTPLYDPFYPTNTWRFGGVGNYVLPEGILMSPGDELLVVPIEPATFRDKYNIPPEIQITGPYTGTLNNAGERIALLRPDEQDTDGTVPYYVADEVQYGDASPWPAEADGRGPALHRIFLDEYGDDPANWRADKLHRLLLPLTIQ